MNAAAIIDMARKLAFTKQADVSDAALETYLDDVVHEYYQEFKKHNFNFAKATHYMDTVPYQNDYTLPTISNTVAGVDKILHVAVKYKLDNYPAWAANTGYLQNQIVTYLGNVYIAKDDIVGAGTFQSSSFQKIYPNYANGRETNFYPDWVGNLNSQMTLYTPSDLYAYNVPANWVNPLYIKAGNTLSIYPYAQEIVKEGIIIDYIPTPLQITAASSEAAIVIPIAYHSYIARSLVRYVFYIQNKAQQAALWEQKHLKALDDAVMAAISPSYSTESQQDPDLSCYS